MLNRKNSPVQKRKGEKSIQFGLSSHNPIAQASRKKKQIAPKSPMTTFVAQLSNILKEEKRIRGLFDALLEKVDENFKVNEGVIRSLHALVESSTSFRELGVSILEEIHEKNPNEACDKMLTYIKCEDMFN
jgi:hypothetical protein